MLFFLPKKEARIGGSGNIKAQKKSGKISEHFRKKFRRRAILTRCELLWSRLPLTPLSFLSLFFWGKRHGKPPKKQGFSIPTEPLKSLEKKGKTVEKHNKFLAGKKTRNSKKNKERKDRDTTDIDFGCTPCSSNFLLSEQLDKVADLHLASAGQLQWHVQQHEALSNEIKHFQNQGHDFVPVLKN